MAHSLLRHFKGAVSGGSPSSAAMAFFTRVFSQGIEGVGSVAGEGREGSHQTTTWSALGLGPGGGSRAEHLEMVPGILP